MKPTPILSATIMALVLLALPPSMEPVSACIWNPTHSFSPTPPCEEDAEATLVRISQYNGRILGKLATVAAKAQEVATETEQWLTLREEARVFERNLKSVRGNIQANPIPSMVSEFNRSNPMSMVMQIQYDEDGGASIEMADPREVGDSVLARFEAEIDVLYSDVRRTQDRLEDHLSIRAGRLEEEFRAITDFRSHSSNVRDSLQAVGDRVAQRYENDTRAMGDAEAAITSLSAAVNRLRGTAYEAELRALQARTDALEYGAHGGRAGQVHKANAPRFRRY